MSRTRTRALLLCNAILDDAVRALLPGLWLYEVGNTFARRFPAQAPAVLSVLIKFGIEEAPPSHPWLVKTLELTSCHDVMFYDAAYHSARAGLWWSARDGGHALREAG
jgi:hypothetical protein